MRQRIIAMCVLVFAAASAARADYTTLATVCVLGTDRFALNVVFDEELNREKLVSSVGSALMRAGFQEQDCERGHPIEESDAPILVAPATGERALTLVVYSGLLPTMQPVADDVFIAEFAEWDPSIFIDQSGKWVLRARTRGKGSVGPPHHGPPSAAYTHPRTLLRCSNPTSISEHEIESDHLVQIVEVSCGDGAPPDRLMFFGLGNFTRGMYGKGLQITVGDAAYLALEFDVHRLVVQLVK